MDLLQMPLENAQVVLHETIRRLNYLLRLRGACNLRARCSPPASQDIEIIIAKEIDSLVSRTIQLLLEFQIHLQQTIPCNESLKAPNPSPDKPHAPEINVNALDSSVDGNLPAHDSFGHDPGGQSSVKSPRAEAERNPPVIRHKRSRPKDSIPGDLWGWHKYGQKAIKGEGILRRYFRCSHQAGGLTCPAKRQVDRLDSNGQITAVMYEGKHNHEPPEPRTTIVFQDGNDQED